MSYYRDMKRRNSFSYKVKRWFWSNHKEEVKKVFYFIGEFLMALCWLGLIFIIPHSFH